MRNRLCQLLQYKVPFCLIWQGYSTVCPGHTVHAVHAVHSVHAVHPTVSVRAAVHAPPLAYWPGHAS